jgi:autotransporter-associated beta strand protein
MAWLLGSAPVSAQNQDYWSPNGSTTDFNWSTAGNWSFEPPGSSDMVIFDVYGATNGPVLVNNVANTSTTISALYYEALSNTNAWHTTQINPGVTLSIVPQTGNPTPNSLAVGEWIGGGYGSPATNANNDTVYAGIVGPAGTLNLNGPNTSIRIEQAGGGGSHLATLNMSNLNTFTATVSNVLIGADLGSISLMRPNGTLILAQTNTITTMAMGTARPGIILGCGGWTNSDGGIGNLTLGYANTLKVDWLAVGGHRGNQGANTLGFGSITNGSLTLRSSSGARAPLLSVGDQQASDTYTADPSVMLPNTSLLWGTSRGTTGAVNVAGSRIDILVDSLILGRNLTTNENGTFNTGATGVANGSMTFDNGIIDVNNLYLGYKIGTNYGGAVGTLTANGGTLNVNNSLIMSSRTYVNGGFNGGSGTATLTIASNAVANVKTDIVKGTPGQGSATLNVNNGGLLNLQPAGRAGNIAVDTLTVNGGMVQNASNITVGGTVALTGTTLTGAGGTFSAATLNLNTNSLLLNVSNITVSGTINLNGGAVSNGAALTSATLTGNGTIANVLNVTNGTSLLPGSSDSAGGINVGGNLTLKTNASMTFAVTSATTTDAGVNSYLNVAGDLTFLANNPFFIAPLAQPAAGPYRLVDYTGALNGTPVFTNTTRFALGLDLSTLGQINLTNGGGSAAALTWKGTNANWDLIATSNWLSGGVAQQFYQFDSVTFDSTGVNTNVNVTGLLYPQSITVNDSRTYTLGSSGKISGNASITKNGTGTLLVTNTGGNDFNGAILVNNGIYKITRADAFGSTNGTTTVASGATLDLNGTSANSPGEFVTISGNGVNGTGAITNSGGDQQNALRYVSLAANASTGVNAPGRWDVRGSGGNGSFSGGLFLNGFTYTKNGPGKHEIADSICTNGGSLVNNGGILAFTRSLVDGPGTVTTLGTNMLLLENNSTGTVSKPLIFQNTSVLQLVGNSFVLSSPITNQNTGAAGLTIDTASGLNLTLTNVLSGSGVVTKTSAGTLMLQAPDLCTGPTVISAGTLALTNAGSLPNTPSINLAASSTTLDASGIGTLTLGGGQTLSGSGTVLGSLATSSGTTLVPGNSLGTLTVSRDLTLNSVTNLFELGGDPTQIGNGANDLIAVGGNLNLSGLSTIKVTPLAPLNTSTPYTLITYSNALSGGLGNLRAVSTNPRYVLTLSSAPNAIQLSASGLPVSLVWHGGQSGNPSLWDTGATANWLNTGSPDVFFAGDSVIFDDTSLTNQISVPGNVLPGDISVNNNSLNYTVSGTGGLIAGSLDKEGSGSFTLANTGTNLFSLGVTNNAGTLAVTGSTNFSALEGIQLNAGTLALSPPADMTLSSVVSDNGGGAGTLQKQGTNLLYLTGNNSNYNGAMLVSGGILRPRIANSLGVSTFNGVTVASGGTLDVNGQNLGLKPVTAIGAGAGGLGAIYNSGAGQNNALNNLTLTGDTTFGGTGRWDLRNQTINGTPYNATLSTGGQPFTLTKVGINQCSFVNAQVDTALGNIDVQQGVLSIESSTFNLGNVVGDPNYTITVRSNAELDLWGLINALNKPVSLLDGGIITNGSGDNVVSSAITLNGSGNIVVGNGTLSLNGSTSPTGYALNGTGSLVKGGGNTLNLYGQNNFAGPVSITAGNVAIDNSLAFTANKNITMTTIAGGGGATGTRITLGIAYGGSWVVPPGVSVSMPSSQPGDLRSVLYANKGYSEWQGPITFYAQAGAVTPGSVGMSSDASNSVFVISGRMSGVLTNLILRGGNGGRGIVSGGINISNPGGLPPRVEKTEVSMWTLMTNNNVWGDTIIHNGILQLGTNNACPTTTFLSLGENIALCALDLNGFNQQVAGLNATATLTNDYIVNSSSVSDSTLTIAGNAVTNFGGIISDTQTFSTNGWVPAGTRHVALTLAAANTGSLTLTGTNAYTGPTLINGGTLFVNGALSNTVVTVNNGGTFGGTGLVLGPVAVNSGGTLAFGPAIGTFAVSNNVTLAAGSTTIMKANTSASDQLAGVGSLTYGGTLVVTNIGTNALAGGTVLKLFDAASYSGSFAAIVPATPGPSATWDTSNLAVNGTLKVVSTAPPYPPQFNGTPVVQGDGSFRLTFSGPSGFGYRIWASTNVALTPVPATWSVLSSGTFGTSPVTFTDSHATNYSARFYEITIP